MTPLRQFKPGRLLSGLWCLALALYILAGVPLATFHGDESMLVYASHDFVTAFIEQEPAKLMTRPPYEVDSDAHLRILNGTVNRHAIGLSWYLAGMTEEDLPSLWHWGSNYYQNVERGARPAGSMLIAARLHSAVALVCSAVIFFLIALRSGGRALAYLTSALYVANPVLLLNGRRAMQEGLLLCFGLLTILLAIIISQKREQAAARLWPWWGALVLSGGLTLASKHSGILFVLSALGWILLAALARRDLAALAATVLKLLASGTAILLLFIILSPALWNNPVARLQDLVKVRQELLKIQVNNEPVPFEQRVGYIVTQPFMEPLAHYEQPVFWPDAEPITEEIERYESSILDGIHFGRTAGMLLTILAVVGLLFVLSPSRSGLPRSFTVGLLGWMSVTITGLLANPLPWQRYYLPWIPIVTMLAGIALLNSVRLLVILFRSIHLTRSTTGREVSR